MANSNPDARQITAHAVLIGDRINTAGLEGQILSNSPFAVRVGSSGVAVVFRYGVVVFIGLSTEEEADFLERLRVRSFGKITPPEEEWAKIQVAKEAEEPIPVGGPILVREFSLERLLVVSDALAKSVVLGRDEREVTNVFDTIEPFARELANFGKTPCSFSIACRAGSRSGRSRTCSGTGPILRGSMPAWKTNTSSANAPRH